MAKTKIPPKTRQGNSLAIHEHHFFRPVEEYSTGWENCKGRSPGSRVVFDTKKLVYTVM